MRAVEPWWADGCEGEERQARWACWCVEGVGAARMGQLANVCEGQFVRFWREESLRRRVQLLWGVRVCDGLMEVWREEVEVCWARAQEQGQGCLYIGDEAYPAVLRALADAPVFVSVQGASHAWARPGRLAMVGSREVPQRWLAWTERAARQVAEASGVVVSGGALGIDAAAHEGALSGGGETVVVMPGGLWEPAPRSHRGLFERVVEGGGVLLSEYPPWAVVRRPHFARRNRLIAALGQACVVVRAREGSGALHTARAALGLGRVVGALPFDVEDEGGAGGVELLACGGAVMVRRAEELLGLVGLTPAPARAVLEPRAAVEGPDGRAGEVWREVARRGEMRLEEVMRVYGMSVGEAQGVMLDLELGGWAVRAAGGAGWRVA